MAGWENVFLLVGGGLGGVVLLLGLLGWTGVIGFGAAVDAAASRGQGRILAILGAGVLISAVAPGVPWPFGKVLGGVAALAAVTALLLVASSRRKPSRTR